VLVLYKKRAKVAAASVRRMGEKQDENPDFRYYGAVFSGSGTAGICSVWQNLHKHLQRPSGAADMY
jgi:hypothetical protein